MVGVCDTCGEKKTKRSFRRWHHDTPWTTCVDCRKDAGLSPARTPSRKAPHSEDELLGNSRDFLLYLRKPLFKDDRRSKERPV